MNSLQQQSNTFITCSDFPYITTDPTVHKSRFGLRINGFAPKHY